MASFSTALIRLYPRGWRQRYGAEMAEVLAREPLTIRSVTDLLAGAIDARLNPGLVPPGTPPNSEGVAMTCGMYRCAPVRLSRQDHLKSAAWMLGGSLVMAAAALALRATLGENTLSEALLLGAFPAALMLSNEPTYFKPYSRAVRLTLSLGGAFLILLLMWISIALGQRI